MLKWLVAIAGVSLAGVAAAQDYRPAPASLPGALTESDPRDGQGRHFNEYPLELVRGQRITITVEPASGSRVVPAILLLDGRPIAGEAAPRLVHTASRDGLHTLRIVATGPELGNYRLSIQSTPAAAPSRSFQGRAIGGPAGAAIGAPAPVGVGDPTGGSGPRSRFIICPGHPRCPRR